MTDDAADAHERRAVVASDGQALTAIAGTHVRRRLVDAIAARGACWIALAGGRTPKAVYERLAEAGTPAIDWARVHVAFGDERLVPPDHADSNYGMARAALLARVPIPAHQVHRIEGERLDADAAAAAYSAVLAGALRPEPGAWPVFDLVLLGVGADGHTASIFPGTAAVRETRRLAVAGDAPTAPERRVTLTFPVLNAARAVVILASGADKASAIARAFTDGTPVAECPVRGVRPASGMVTWLLDAAAAADLPTPAIE